MWQTQQALAYMGQQMQVQYLAQEGWEDHYAQAGVGHEGPQYYDDYYIGDERGLYAHLGHEPDEDTRVEVQPENAVKPAEVA